MYIHCAVLKVGQDLDGNKYSLSLSLIHVLDRYDECVKTNRRRDRVMYILDMCLVICNRQKAKKANLSRDVCMLGITSLSRQRVKLRAATSNT